MAALLSVRAGSWSPPAVMNQPNSALVRATRHGFSTAITTFATKLDQVMGGQGRSPSYPVCRGGFAVMPVGRLWCTAVIQHRDDSQGNTNPPQPRTCAALALGFPPMRRNVRLDDQLRRCVPGHAAGGMFGSPRRSHHGEDVIGCASSGRITSTGLRDGDRSRSVRIREIDRAIRRARPRVIRAAGPQPRDSTRYP